MAVMPDRKRVAFQLAYDLGIYMVCATGTHTHTCAGPPIPYLSQRKRARRKEGYRSSSCHPNPHLSWPETKFGTEKTMTARDVTGFCVFSEPPERGRKTGAENWCRAKIVEKCRKIFLTIFDVFLPCAKNVEKYFSRFLTFFDVAPFRWPLLWSADFFSARKSGNFLHVLGCCLTKLHSKPGEKETKSTGEISKNPVETAPRNYRFLSLVVVKRVLKN